MLDPWIIEEIRRREEQQRRDVGQPAVVEMPERDPAGPDEAESDNPKGEPRGIAIIDFRVM